MAGQFINFSIDVTLVATAVNEVVQLKCATNVRGKLHKLVVTGKSSAGGADAPSDGRLTLSSANFGTFTGTVVKTKANPSNGETLQTTFSGNTTGGTPSTTPTNLGIYFTAPPQSGINVTSLLPVGGLEVPGGYAVNVELTNAAIVTHRISGVWEE